MFTQEFNKTRLEHEKYQMSLSKWDMFVIWSYTFGSGVPNKYLLGMIDEKIAISWSRRIYETCVVMEISPNDIFLSFFQKIKNNEPYNLDLFIKNYIINLQKIIVNSPPLFDNIIAYKASSSYDELSEKQVYQKPFNSCSYKINFNYSMFLPKDKSCCMHQLLLKKNTKCLILSPLLSAYPDESEIILPYGVVFNIIDTGTMELKMPVNDNLPKWKKIQKMPFYLGPVYEYKHKLDCQKKSIKVKLYKSIVIF